MSHQWQRPLAAKKIVSVQQDGNCNDGEGTDSDDLGSDDGEGSGSDEGDGDGSGSNDREDKAMHIPFRMTPSRILWYKCPICLGEKYDSKAKVGASRLRSHQKRCGDVGRGRMGQPGASDRMTMMMIRPLCS
jgi:hypothetical protein